MACSIEPGCIRPEKCFVQGSYNQNMEGNINLIS